MRITGEGFGLLPKTEAFRKNGKNHHSEDDSQTVEHDKTCTKENFLLCGVGVCGGCRVAYWPSAVA